MAIFDKMMGKILHAGEGKKLREYQSIVDIINKLEVHYVDLPDSDFASLTEQLRERYWGDNYKLYCKFIAGEITFNADGHPIDVDDDEQNVQNPQVLHERTPLEPLNGESLDTLLPEAFAIVREASKRVLEMRHFDVQLLGGIALFKGNIAEMKTGEGKTLVATAPAYLAAISGLGVHIVTVNDYLASYQSEIMGRVFDFLGMTTGCVVGSMNSTQKREAYAKDITYGTNNQFGFDYLNDNLTTNIHNVMQRAHNYAIVDEVDSILIDEARTPLIISGSAGESEKSRYIDIANFARSLTKATNINREIPEMLRNLKGEDSVPNGDYEVDEKNRTVGVLESAVEKLENHLGVSNLYSDTSLVQLYVPLLQNAVTAKELYLRDREYVVQNGEIKIVDEHTGRILEGRRYSEGLHQAIEAKEGVEIKEENHTLATITLQNYFRLYNKLSGMTGTAETEAAEFSSTYDIGVISIPTNKPMIRQDQVDLLFKNEKGKYQAIIDDVKMRNEIGQPVLIGTISVEKSEEISKALKLSGIKCNVLNAKQHEKEADIIAMAGRKGAVTVATNMAGRGTDIMLGGNYEHLAKKEMEKLGYDFASDNADLTKNDKDFIKIWHKTLHKMQKQTEAEHDEVVSLGGLYVLGTERHESRRIDNQLRGRSGRQGDPGESRFYLSMEDNLMRLFGGDKIKGIMQMVQIEDDIPIENKMLSNTVQRSQAKVEARNFEIRKNVLKYDDVLTKQRKVIYKDRNRVLYGEDLTAFIQNAIENSLHNLVNDNFGMTDPKDWNWHSFWELVNDYYPKSYTIEKFQAAYENLNEVSQITNKLISNVNDYYLAKRIKIGETIFANFERTVLLYIVDKQWRIHLQEMDYLRKGIGLRSMAGKDPIVEYTNEASKHFIHMKNKVESEVMATIIRTPDENILSLGGVAIESGVKITAQNGPDESGSFENDHNFNDNESDENQNKLEIKNKPKVNTAVSSKKAAVEANNNGTNPFVGTPKNSPCPCGSGKKYKICHGLGEKH